MEFPTLNQQPASKQDSIHAALKASKAKHPVWAGEICRDFLLANLKIFNFEAEDVAAMQHQLEQEDLSDFTGGVACLCG